MDAIEEVEEDDESAEEEGVREGGRVDTHFTT